MSHMRQPISLARATHPGGMRRNNRCGAEVADDKLRHHWSDNRLLAAIPVAARGALEPHAQHVELAKGQVLFEPEEDVVITHFPLTGTLAALVIALEDGRDAQAANIGREGAIGGIVSCGHKPAFARAVTVIAGPAIRIDTARIETAKESSVSIRELFARYSDALMAQLLQAVSCNAVHSLEQRFARWLLMTHDRVASSELAMTQEIIAEMLGVHRTTVIRLAKELQDKGLIHYGRGRFQITSRTALEEAVCECYGAVVRHYVRMMPAVKPAGKSSRHRNAK